MVEVLLNETNLCRKAKQTYITAPGLIPITNLKESLKECICRIFEITECELKEEGKGIGVIFAKHLHRAMLMTMFDMSERETASIVGCSCIAVHHSKLAYRSLFETNKCFREKANKILSKINRGLIYKPK